MKLHNLMEDEVVAAVDKITEGMNDVCRCEICRLDMASIALNNLKPKYVVTDKGEVFAKAYSLDFQFSTDLVAEVTKAIEIVKKNPRHK
ncbi:MAG: late competence development ComFB family protein [Tissierellaceae bacterium]|nr:late competence development ComFB family protein [Tissierellaceae bacterium]